KYKEEILKKGWIKDPFAEGNLQAQVHWSGYEFLLGIFLIAGVLLSLWFFRKEITKLAVGVFVTTLLFTTLTVFIITPKIEGYSQRAAIEFFQSHAGENAYMEVWAYKSYAPYFYFKQPPPKGNRPTEKQLLTGYINEPVYVVTKNFNAKEFQKRYPDFSLLYMKNGFAFFGKPAFSTPKNLQQK
ncbi:MAG: hypothetical protein JXR71_04940, partial [Bacteroidales bacterium]|nr:hypothetical protein [Bacteroidales bacterium]